MHIDLNFSNLINNLNSIVFRADVSNDVGLGHIMRCSNFVEGLPIKIKPFLISKNDLNLKHFTEFLTEKGWTIIPIPKDTNNLNDAILTAKYIKEVKAGVLITDLVHHDNIVNPGNLAKYHSELRKQGVSFIISIEDCRMSKFSSHIAIIPIPCKGFTAKDKVQDNCILHIGYEYFIFSPKFFPVKKNIIRRKARRVLVCIGGTDPYGTSYKIVCVLNKMKNEDIEAKIIMGNGSKSKFYDKTAEICNSNSSLELLNFNNSINEIFNWCDIAIVGEGLIKYEAALTGTPSILITQHDHNSNPILGFIELGCSKYIGASHNISQIEIANEIIGLLNDYSMRSALSKIGLSTFDGNGTINIYNNILNTILHRL